jgi:hypothetical protein
MCHVVPCTVYEVISSSCALYLYPTLWLLQIQVLSPDLLLTVKAIILHFYTKLNSFFVKKIQLESLNFQLKKNCSCSNWKIWSNYIKNKKINHHLVKYISLVLEDSNLMTNFGIIRQNTHSLYAVKQEVPTLKMYYEPSKKKLNFLVVKCFWEKHWRRLVLNLGTVKVSS